MNTVGVFAGRGDIVLAMGVSFILGMFASYYLRKAWMSVTTVFTKK